MNQTRYGPEPLVMLATAAVLSSFISGAGVAVLATQPPIAARALSVPCQDVPDVIGCLIEEADKEASEPPQ